MAPPKGTATAPTAFVIFGVTGDLSARKLLPALYDLYAKGDIHKDTVVIGFGRSDTTAAAMRSDLSEAVSQEVEDFDASVFDDLCSGLAYVKGSYDDKAAYDELAAALTRVAAEVGSLAGHIFYTATPPSVYADIATGLAGAGLAAEEPGRYSRLVVEKPFGDDLASAKELNRSLLEVFREAQIYRIDHYLAKETAQNLAVLRFANTVFEPLWNNRYIDHVQITMSEQLGVEGRGSFYEQAGVLRDVFQNHLLQLLALVAMEPPARFDADAVRDEKVKLLRSIVCPQPHSIVLGQYSAGAGFAGYKEEDGVPGDSRQATYAALTLEVRNWRFSGTPFYLRSGKRLEAKASEVVLQFRNPPHIPFDLPRPPRPDRLILRLVPDEGITLRFNGKRPGQRIDLDRIDLGFSYEETFSRPNPDAYVTLLLDVMAGDATLFMRADEVEAQWAILDPLLSGIAERQSVPEPYAAGGPGPQAAYQLLERDGRFWHKPDALKYQEE
ncbi:MAG TPA: glucose-6-phosphate dehydrogenase [Trueperaceae bacterium]|nr:glucose-6-phosphate dehydrogenase [Trueperaceae bacterium]